MNLTRGIPVDLPHAKGMVFGGPYRQYVPGTRRLFGVKMAVEIGAMADVYVDTEDFSVPSVSDMQQGLIKTLQLMSQGNDAYVGCMGGIGRTGLFMSCMVKSVAAIKATLEEPPLLIGVSPVEYVRSHYNPHAVETHEQQGYVRNFNTLPVEQAYFESIAPRPITSADSWVLTTLRALGF